MSTSTQSRTVGRRTLVTSVSLACVFLAGACGGSAEPTADDVRTALMKQLTESGRSSEVASCMVTSGLAEFEPSELMNPSGTATEAVTEGMAAIEAICSTPETTVPETTIPETTVPVTTVPVTTDRGTTVPETTAPATTAPELDLAAFCASSEDVYISLLAGDLFDAPAPATLEAYVPDLIDRIELAIVTAPNSDFTVQPNALLDAVRAIDEALTETGYDIESVPTEDVSAPGDIVDGARDDLEAFLEQCDTGSDVDAEASALAAEFVALGTGDVPPAEGDSRGAESPDQFISSDVPAAWTSEFGETVDGVRVFIVATDAEAFATSWGVDGVRFSGLDTTEDFIPLMDESDAARECTLVSEEDYEDVLYIGKLRRYEGCGEGTEAVVIGANDIDGEGTVLVELQMIEFDESVLTLITESFVV